MYRNVVLEICLCPGAIPPFKKHIFVSAKSSPMMSQDVAIVTRRCTIMELIPLKIYLAFKKASFILSHYMSHRIRIRFWLVVTMTRDQSLRNRPLVQAFTLPLNHGGSKVRLIIGSNLRTLNTFSTSFIVFFLHGKELDKEEERNVEEARYFWRYLQSTNRKEATYQSMTMTSNYELRLMTKCR